jgi:hypothetical protein
VKLVITCSIMSEGWPGGNYMNFDLSVKSDANVTAVGSAVPTRRCHSRTAFCTRRARLGLVQLDP